MNIVSNMAVNVCYCVKLSPNKKSIFGLRMNSQILYFVLFASFLAVVSAADMDKTCASVQSFFEKKGMLSAVDIQALPNSDAGELCSNQGCCGPAARGRLVQQARGQLEGALRSELTKLADILANRAKRFDEFFRKLLKLSREGFHSMFKRTYGIIYEQHSYVFEQFFEQLERYYARGDTNFDAMMDSFFSILYQKMFIVLNSQYNFDEKYLKCVSEHMRDIQPFEDVPSKLSVQLRRAFVATRTFHKALRSGADVVNNMKQVGVSQECVTAWARLRHCGACAGERPPACSRYCHNVLRGCLPTHADLSDHWDAYVDAVEKVADRLLGPFNIAMVVEPIDIKISEAIMSFQERNQEISQKIFSGCGKPDLGGAGGAGPFFAPDRARRFARAIPDFDWYHRGNDVDDFEIEASFESLYNNDASLLSLRTPEGIRRATAELAEQAKSRDRFLQYMRGRISLDEFEEHERRKRAAEPEAAPGGGELDYRAFEFDGKRGGKKKKPAAGAGGGAGGGGDAGAGGAASGPALERLVRETRARVRSSRRYWTLLPAVLCSSASVTTAPCFNGTHVASYTAITAGEGTAALASNPEVRGAGGPGAAGAGAAGRAQLDALRALTARLKDAYNGVEVQWKDASDAVADELQAAASSDFADALGSGSGSGDGDGDDDTEPGAPHAPDWQPPDDDEDRDYPEGSGDRSIDEPSPEPERPAASEPPLEPTIVQGPATNNAQPAPTAAPPDHTSVRWQPQEPREPRQPGEPPASAADRPSLAKALFTYALPVVCAWFGTIVTDLF